VEFPSSGALLELNDVHKSFGHTQGDQGREPQSPQGRARFVIFGPSGGGKSTFAADHEPARGGPTRAR